MIVTEMQPIRGQKSYYGNQKYIDSVRRVGACAVLPGVVHGV